MDNRRFVFEERGIVSKERSENRGCSGRVVGFSGKLECYFVDESVIS